MDDGVAVAICYGGRPWPNVTLEYTPDFKANVPFLWDVGSKAFAYSATSSYEEQAGYAWYTKNGFETTLNVINGLGHDRSGQSGGIMTEQ